MFRFWPILRASSQSLWLIYDHGGNLPSIVSNKALSKLVTDQRLVFNTDVSFTSYPGNLGEFIDGKDNLNIAI